MFRLLSTSFILAIFLLLGCGSARDATPKHDPVVAPAVRVFPARDFRLVTNAVFAWKRDVRAAHVDSISELGDQFGLLRSTIGKLKEMIASLPNPANLDPQKRTSVEQTRAMLEKKIAEAAVTLEKVQFAMGQQSDEIVFPQMISVTFKPQMAVEISGWTYGGQTRNFSSRNGSIDTLSYQPVGGRLQFSLHTGDGKVLQFRLARNRYDLDEKGVTSFIGDVTFVQDWESRPGLAKLLGQYVGP